MNALSDINPVSRWLDVFGSSDHKLDTLPKNVAFVDINCDLDLKLVIGDLGLTNNIPKLKIFKGTSMINEIFLPDIPTNVVSFFANESLPRSSPSIAVALCSSIYVYKNMKLFYKFHLPQLEVSSLEIEIWKKLADPFFHNEEAVLECIEKLETIQYQNLTPQSQHLLSITPDKCLDFIKENFDSAQLERSSVITCMTTLNMNSLESSGVACLVYGTENGDITILDPQTFTVLYQARINNTKLTPSQIETVGLFDVDYKLIISTREGSVCLLKREWLEGKCLFQLPAMIVEFIVMPGENSIIVATTDKTLQSFNKKGRKNWSISVPNAVSTINLVQLEHLGMNLVAVAMIGGLIHFYNGRNLVDSFSVQDTISVMKFGQLGQEENVLALITTEGALILKILKRTADFNANSSGNFQKTHPSYMSAQPRPLLVPKKSKLFLEQATREREQASEMHETFQRELLQLRLHVAKATTESILSVNNSLNIGSSQPLKLSATVEGLGPVFKIHLSLENLSDSIPVTNLALLFCDNQSYKISTPYIMVPMIVPGSPYVFISRVTEIFAAAEETMSTQNNDEAESERLPLKIFLIKRESAQPLLTALIHIPPTDPLMMPFY